MPNASIRYDVPTSTRLIRALPVVFGYIALVVVLLMSLPEAIQRLSIETVVVVGLIGLVRYCWVLTQCIRAALYEHYLYPRLRIAADRLPEELQTPKKTFIIVPTFGEKPEVSRQMLLSVLEECARIRSQFVVVVNAGSEEEDDLFRAVLNEHVASPSLDVRFVRQIGGKRQGIADCLALLMREPVDDSDLLILMDGDTVLGEGVMQKCFPLFALCPNLGGVTTDNIAVTKGNWLYRKWYTLRFSMRHRMMKSQSLSRQLLVLTGRFSVFRAKECLTNEFISYLEDDRIPHWLHGDIKFVTGDDKSTWFCLLKRGREMLYVPDAHIYCMEDSGPKPFTQSIKKMHRWFGNMLRNNGRAIRLGPGRMKPFIWWSLVDQRISMFTSLLGPFAAVWAAYWLSPYYLLVYAIIVIMTRMVYALVLTIEGHRMSATDIPLLLYTQWVGGVVKVYTLFHLHEQKWDAHRGGATGRRATAPLSLNVLIPRLQIAVSFSLLIAFVAALIGIKSV